VLNATCLVFLPCVPISMGEINGPDENGEIRGAERDIKDTSCYADAQMFLWVKKDCSPLLIPIELRLCIIV